MAPLSVSLQPGKWLVEYFANRTLTAPAVSIDTASAIAFDWAGAAPPGLPADSFSLRYQGTFSFEAQPYDFTVRADDGVRLLVDDVLVIDQWKDQSATSYVARRIMTAGEHKVTVEFYENGGWASLLASWAVYIPPDTQAPRLTSIAAASIVQTSAQISWVTDDPALVIAEFGETTTYGRTMPAGVSPAILSGLLPGTTYHYRLRSTDGAGNVAVSPDATFTTAAPPPPPPPPPVIADWHISPFGNDSNDGRSRATAWKTLERLKSGTPPPALSRIALYQGLTPIMNSATSLQRAYHFTSPPGEHPMVQGLGKITLDCQNWTGGSFLPGAGGSMRFMPPLTPTEPTAADGEKAGVNLGRCVSFIASTGVQFGAMGDDGLPNIKIVAGTDYALFVQNTLRSAFVCEPSDYGEAFRMGGNLGQGADATTVTGWAHDGHRMVRNTKVQKGDDYGSVAFSWVNSTGGIQKAGWRVDNSWAFSFDYKGDGGAFEWYNADHMVVEPGVAHDTECGFETGGSAGKGNHHNLVMPGVRLTGDLSPGCTALGIAAKSPGTLIRNAAFCEINLEIDATNARADVEVYPDTGQFGGSIENTTVNAKVVRHGARRDAIRDIAGIPGLRVNVIEVAALT